MKPTWAGRIAMATFLLNGGLAWAFQPDVFSQERNRLLTSALYQQAKAAGGKLYTVGKANQANIHGDLGALMKASDEVLVVHIIRNNGQLSPSGASVITMYDAQILQAIKGGTAQSVIWFSVPAGAVRFDSTTIAAASFRNFAAPVNGGRYVVFLRFAQGEERKLTPARRLTGDAVQGAFELNDEFVEPAFREDTLSRTYWHMPVTKFLNTLQILAAAQKAN